MKNYEDYNNVNEFIEEVEAADYWNEIEPKVYERFLEDYGLDYGSYDDPDRMWADFLEAVNK